MRRAPLHALWVAALALGGPSYAEPSDPPTAEAGDAIPAVELHGRRAIALRDGRPVYRFDDDRYPVVRVNSPLGLTLRWVDAEGRTHGLDARAEARGAMSFLVAHGRPPLGVGELQLRLAGATIERWLAEWRISPERLPAVARVRALAAEIEAHPTDRAGRCANRSEVRDIVDRRRLDDDGALWAARVAARLQTTFGEPGDDAFAGKEAAYLRAAEVARRQSVPSERASRLCAAAFQALIRADFATAEAHIEAARSISPVALDAETRLRIADVSSQLYYVTARWRAAHEAVLDATRAAERAGPAVDRLAANVRQTRAALALVLGDHRTAIELIEPLVDDPQASPAEKARAANNAGYILLQAMGRGAIPRDFERIRRLFGVAAAFFADGEPSARAHVQLNLALVEQLDGRWSAAADLIAPLRDSADAEIRAVASLLAGRLELAQGRWAEAHEPFTAAEAAAVERWGADGGDYGWRAELGLGQAARAQGDAQAAEAHFARARARLERLATSTDPLQQRVAFFADRDELARASLTLALERDDQASLRRAFTMADRNQGRVLRTMLAARLGARLGPEERRALAERRARIAAAADAVRALEKKVRRSAGAAQRRAERALAVARARQRDAVQRAVDFVDAELPPTGVEPAKVQAALDPGQTIMAVARHDGGRVALWASATAYEATPLPDVVDDDTLPTPPWPTAHLYVVAGGHPDVVRAAFRVATLRAHSVSLLPAGELLVAARRRPSAPSVILADPTSDLKGASAEGEWLTALLPDARLFSRDAVTREALVQSLESAWLVHFSGHGELDLERPWATHLRMSRKVPFDVFDVLAIREAVSGLAVLNGCETGADTLSTRDDVLGLPEALMVVGTAAVVATDQPVADADAKLFSELFYAHGGELNPGPALHAAMRILRDSGNQSWDNWRLVGRPHLNPIARYEEVL